MREHYKISSLRYGELPYISHLTYDVYNPLLHAGFLHGRHILLRQCHLFGRRNEYYPRFR